MKRSIPARRLTLSKDTIGALNGASGAPGLTDTCGTCYSCVYEPGTACKHTRDV